MKNFKMTPEERTVRVVNYAVNTYEYIGESDAHVASMTGLPAFSTTTKPPKEKEGYARIYDEDKDEWRYERDLRGTTVYNKANSMPLIINEFGEIPEGFTTSKPFDDFSKWDDEKWILDEERKLEFKHQANAEIKKNLLREAAERIIVLQSAVKYEIATEDEILKLTQWEKYSVIVSRLDPTSEKFIEPAKPE